MGALPGRRGLGSRETVPEIKCLARQQEEDSVPGHEQTHNLQGKKFQGLPSDKTGKHICSRMVSEEKLNLQHFKVACSNPRNSQIRVTLEGKAGKLLARNVMENKGLCATWLHGTK